MGGMKLSKYLDPDEIRFWKIAYEIFHAQWIEIDGIRAKL